MNNCKFCYKPVTQSDIDKCNTVNISGSLNTTILSHWTCLKAEQDKPGLFGVKTNVLKAVIPCCELGSECAKCEWELERI